MLFSQTMKRKFFVLQSATGNQDAQLQYYDSEKKWQNNVQPKRLIILKDCFVIKRRMDAKQHHALALYTTDDCFSIVFDKESEMEHWLQLMVDIQSSVRLSNSKSLPSFGKDHPFPVKFREWTSVWGRFFDFWVVLSFLCSLKLQAGTSIYSNVGCIYQTRKFRWQMIMLITVSSVNGPLKCRPSSYTRWINISNFLCGPFSWNSNVLFVEVVLSHQQCSSLSASASHVSVNLILCITFPLSRVHSHLISKK